MAGDPDKDEVVTWLASIDADRLSDYVRRGRKYASLSAEQLSKAWEKAFRAWVQFHTSELMRRERDDLGAEMELRGIPITLTSDLDEIIRKAATEAIEALKADPERYREVEDSLQGELETFRRRHDLKN